MPDLGPLFDDVQPSDKEASGSESEPSAAEKRGHDPSNKSDSAWEESNQQEVAALDRLFQRSERLRRTDAYRDFLKFVSRFSDYSPYNAALLHLQNPGVKYVATPNQWEKRFERSVEPDARPYVILQPFGPVLFVFDVDDTVPIGDNNGGLPERVKNPFSVEGEIRPRMWSQVVENCQNEEGIAIRTSKNLHRNYAGRIEKMRHKIRRSLESDLKDCTHLVTLREGENVTREQKYAVLAHELGHLFCGHLGTSEGDWWPKRKNVKPVKEIEAESVAYLVCRRAGLTSQSDWYLRNHLKEMGNEELLPPIRVRVILDAVNYIEKLEESTFESKREQ